MKSDHTSLPNLVIPADKAKQKVQSQIERGKKIWNLDIRNKDDLEEAGKERTKWSKYNTDLLTGIFSGGSVAEEYNRFGRRTSSINPSLNQQVQKFNEDMDDSITKLESILDKIDLIAELRTDVPLAEPSVFIVHGTDPTNTKDQLKNLLTEWGIKAVILNEQSNLGRTIIEKFEKCSDEVGCAIILLTPDDEGRAAGSDDWKPRARQNVMFELGFFFGKLGRDKTICLHKGDIELPSDISGVMYIPFDRDLTEVSHKLRKDLKDIGFPIND